MTAKSLPGVGPPAPAPGIIPIVDGTPGAMLVELAERVIALTAERDRARDLAADLEAENAVLSTAVRKGLAALRCPGGVPRAGLAEFILAKAQLP